MGRFCYLTDDCLGLFRLGFGLVFLSLEQAGKNLYQAVSNATVQTLQHK